MIEVIWNGFLILMVLAVVGLIIGGSWSSPTPLGICHRCGRRVSPPMKHCHDCIPKGKRNE